MQAMQQRLFNLFGLTPHINLKGNLRSTILTGPPHPISLYIYCGIIGIHEIPFVNTIMAVYTCISTVYI